MFLTPTITTLSKLKSPKNHTHKVICNPTGSSVYASVSLLCNVQNILKNNLKQKVSMFAYGQLQYIKKQKAFHFEGNCYTTSSAEIESTWEIILARILSLRLFCLGVIIGIGGALLLPHH